MGRRPTGGWRAWALGIVARSAIAGALTAGALCAFPAPFADAAPITGQQAAAYLDEQRTANGIPSRFSDDPSLDAACAHHDHYRALNPNDYAHDEDPTHPGYTSDGQQLGAPGVQHGPGDAVWSATRNPWSDFPLHLAEIMAPAQQDGTMGYADTEHYACLTLQGPDLVPPSPRLDAFASVPGAGTSGVPPEEDCDGESPPCPAEALGLNPADHGRTIIFFPYGWSWDASTRGNAQSWPRMTAYSLMGPAGAVDARWYDDPFGHLAGYLVPVRPLEPFTQYTATVSWQLDTGEEHTQTVPFTTGDILAQDRPQPPSTEPTDPRLRDPRLRVRLTHLGRRVSVRATTVWRARGTLSVVGRRGHSTQRLQPVKSRRSGADRQTLYGAMIPRGRWNVVVRFAGSSGWASRKATRAVRIR